MSILANPDVQALLVGAVMVWLGVLTTWGRMKQADLDKAKKDIDGVGAHARAALAQSQAALAETAKQKGNGA